MTNCIIIQTLIDLNIKMRFLIVIALFLTILQIQSGNGYKVLGVFPTMAKSHYITGNGLMKALAAAGHEVTVMSAFKESKPIKNYRGIYVGGVVEAMSGIFFF